MSHDASLLSSAPEDMLQFLVSASDHLNRNHRMRRDQMAPKRAARSVMSAASTRWRAQRSFSHFKGSCATCVPQCNLNRVLRFVTEFQYHCRFFCFSVQWISWFSSLRAAGVYGGMSLKIRHLRRVPGVTAHLLTSRASDGYHCGPL